MADPRGEGWEESGIGDWRYRLTGLCSLVEGCWCYFPVRVKGSITTGIMGCLTWLSLTQRNKRKKSGWECVFGVFLSRF